MNEERKILIENNFRYSDCCLYCGNMERGEFPSTIKYCKLTLKNGKMAEVKNDRVCDMFKD